MTLYVYGSVDAQKGFIERWPWAMTGCFFFLFVWYDDPTMLDTLARHCPDGVMVHSESYSLRDGLCHSPCPTGAAYRLRLSNNSKIEIHVRVRISFTVDRPLMWCVLEASYHASHVPICMIQDGAVFFAGHA